jgi:hypothetical protein
VSYPPELGHTEPAEHETRKKSTKVAIVVPLAYEVRIFFFFLNETTRTTNQSKRPTLPHCHFLVRTHNGLTHPGIVNMSIQVLLSVEGDGLKGGNTAEPAHFTIKTQDTQGRA